MHGSIIQAGGLMDVDIQSVIRFHLQRSLHTRFRKDGNGRISPIDSLFETSPDFRQFRLLCFLFLRVIVARQPPGSMVSCHSKLRLLFLNQKISQLWLLGEFITEPYPIIIDTKTKNDFTTFCSLSKYSSILVIMITNGSSLAPYRTPCLIERRGLFTLQDKSIHQISLLQSLGSMFVLCKFQSEV